jgi:O-antigen/teichoic acid export membrane protein
MIRPYKKVSNSILWGWINSAFFASLHFVTLIVLARILEPSDFGLMAIVLTIIGFFQMFVDMGLGVKIIQKKTINSKQLSSIFYFNLIVGLMIFMTIFFSAESLAVFYDNDKVESIVTQVSTVFLFIILGSISHSLLQRRMKFAVIAKIEMMSMAFYTAVTISLALLDFGIYSLIYGYIIRSGLENLGFVIIAKWTPGRWYGLEIIRGYLSFGAYVSASRLVNFFSANIDYILIGKFLGVEALGFYTLAYQLVTFPLKKISRVISTASLPAFSKRQNSNDQLIKIFLDISRQTSMIVFPLIAGIFSVSFEFIDVVYGAKWVQSSDVLMALSLVGAVKAMSTLSSNIFIAKEEMKLAFYTQVASVLMVALSVSISLQYGIVVVAISLSIVALLISFWIQYLVNSMLRLPMKTYFFSFRQALFASVSMVLVIFSVKYILTLYFVFSNYILLPIYITIGILVYFEYYYLFEKKYPRDVLNNMLLK